MVAQKISGFGTFLYETSSIYVIHSVTRAGDKGGYFEANKPKKVGARER
jgi:hypothetical protein